jgi:hypothetical protein
MKKSPKKAKKNITSDAINKIIPSLKPLCTTKYGALHM